jgi:hypothetical protein
MDWRSLAATMPHDTDYPARAKSLSDLTRVLDGTLYDGIDNDFSDEKTAGGEYVPLSKRRPSIRSNICRVVVDDVVSLLFDEGHFPEWTATDKNVTDALRAIAKRLRLNLRMIEAATAGSTGSVALLLRVIGGRPRIEVMPTPFLAPAFDQADGETLTGCVETFKVGRDEWAAMGHPLPVGETEAWWRREWTATEEIVFLPQTRSDRAEGKPPVRMGTNPNGLGTVQHGLGFVPMVWVRNLPGGSGVDGAATIVSPAISTMIELDYQLSQAGRGLKYASDPTLLIKEPAGEMGEARVGGAASALIVSEGGDAKLLEISGTASEAVLGYARVLREAALEAMHGNRTNTDKLSAAQSGRALELMHQPLIWLADKLRISYGEVGLVSLLRMICLASHKMTIEVDGLKFSGLNPDGLLLKWPPWFAPSPDDKQAQAGTLAALRSAGLMSQYEGVRSIAPVYDIEDVDAEIARITADDAAETAKLLARAAVVQAKEPVDA